MQKFETTYSTMILFLEAIYGLPFLSDKASILSLQICSLQKTKQKKQDVLSYMDAFEEVYQTVLNSPY